MAFTPLEANRFANWTKGLMWPCAGYGRTRTWTLFCLCTTIFGDVCDDDFVFNLGLVLVMCVMSCV